MLTYGKCREEDKLGLSNCGEVYAIYILKEYQQKGIGTKLINFAIEDLANENYEKFIVWGLKENPSVEFYKKIGGEIRFKKDIEIGGQILEEIGFMFDIDKLLKNEGVSM
ncbi:MAG: GNAT family N-acetyltransferase [Tissierella sp.]|nr:GNAT family N-acetyltransferase [Tissierella sp.]